MSFDSLARTHGIAIVRRGEPFPVRNPYGPIAGADAAPSALRRYEPVFVHAFGRYPVDLVRRVGLRRVVLCRDLAFAGQRRGAVPDFDHDTLYLDILRGADRPGYLSRVLHHEFFHMVDYKDDGRLYADPEWAALNPQGFRYGRGGKNAQEVRGTGVLTRRHPGFLNHYATTGVEEDKAEIFALLLTDPQAIARRAAVDPVVRAKVQRMRALLARFCPAVDDAFWKRVAAPRPARR